MTEANILTSKQYAFMRSVLFSMITLALYSSFTTTSYAQQASSQCVTTMVGSPSAELELPAGCGATAGDYHNPLALPDEITKLDTIITAINTEMGSYPANGDGTKGSYDGHFEHAGLDIMTVFGNKGPVYAVTDGVVQSIAQGSAVVDDISSCPGITAGCTLRLIHDNDEFTSAYVHVDPKVKKGDKIKRGQVIGSVHNWVGQPGMDHLHLEFRLTENNYNVNPRIYFPELEQFPISVGYGGDVRRYAASVSIPLQEGGGIWAEQFKNHPPCPDLPAEQCWAL